MTGPILLSDRRGKFADIAAAGDGWVVTYRIEGGPLQVLWIHIDADARSVHIDNTLVDVGMDDNTFPRVMATSRGLWLIYRAMRAGLGQAVVRSVDAQTQTLGPERWLGLATGNSPVCLSRDGWAAWQSEVSNVVTGVNLGNGETRVLRFESRPTGLSRFDGEKVVFIDEDRERIPGISNPVFAGGCIVGEGKNGGIGVRVGLSRAVLLSGDCFVPRVSEAKAGHYGAVTFGNWAGPDLVKHAGVCLIAFTEQDVAAATTNQPPKEKDMDPWKVSIAGWDPVIARGVFSKVRAGLGNGVEVEWSKDANDNIHIAVFKDGELQDRSAAPRHVEVKG